MNPASSSSALAVFDAKFGLPDPPSLTFVDHNGMPLSSTNNSTNNSDFLDYGNGIEIALDIEWAHAMAPQASIVVLSATPDFNNFNEDIVQGMATLAGLPGVSVVSASYETYPGRLWSGVAGADLGQHNPGARRHSQPECELLRSIGRQLVLLWIGLSRRHRPKSCRSAARA